MKGDGKRQKFNAKNVSARMELGPDKGEKINKGGFRRGVKERILRKNTDGE